MAVTPPLPCKRVANLECEWPNCKCYPLSPPGETPRAEHWKSMLAKLGGWDNELAAVPAGGVRKLIEEFGNLERELRQAQERCAELEKALVEYRKPPRMIVQCERHKGTPIIFKAYAQTTYASYCPQCENDAAASGPKEG